MGSTSLRRDHFLIIFNRGITALQCCVGLCHTAAWISRKCTCIPFLLRLRPAPRHSFGSSQSPRLSSQGRTVLPTGRLCRTRECVCVCRCCLSAHRPRPYLAVSTSPFCTSASLFLPCRQSCCCCPVTSVVSTPV